jgi:subtilisin family serine protease
MPSPPRSAAPRSSRSSAVSARRDRASGAPTSRRSTSSRCLWARSSTMRSMHSARSPTSPPSRHSRSCRYRQIPNDSLFARSWWYYDAANRHDIHAPEAWDITTGDPSVLVAIMDTGVLSAHPDLGGTLPGSSGQIFTNEAEAHGFDFLDDDDNGYIDDAHGWDFVALAGPDDATAGEDWQNEDNDPNDFAGHGTAVAGLVAAMTNNTIGAAGTSWHASLLPLRVGYSAPGASLGAVEMRFVIPAMLYARVCTPTSSIARSRRRRRPASRRRSTKRCKAARSS